MTEDPALGMPEGSVVEDLATGRIGIVVEVTTEPSQQPRIPDACWLVRFDGRVVRRFTGGIRPFLDPLA